MACRPRSSARCTRPSPKPPPVPSEKPAPVELRGLVKKYGDLVAVDNVDLTVEAGDVYGYLGPNGAGKTTSLRMMLGLIRPNAGSVRLFGRDPQLSVAALDGVAGVVQAPPLFPPPKWSSTPGLFAARPRPPDLAPPPPHQGHADR